MATVDQVYEVLLGLKIKDDNGLWHVYDEAGNEISDPGGILLRANPGALFSWPQHLAEIIWPDAKGHWKHLFKPAYGVEAPATKAECASACRVVLPDVFRASTRSDAPTVTGRVSIHVAIQPPHVGTVTVQVGEECGAAFRVVKPRCYAKTPYNLRADSYSLWMVSAPFTGCGTSVEFGFVRTFATVVAPFVVRNPTVEELVVLL